MPGHPDADPPTRRVTMRFDVDLWAWVQREALRDNRSAANFVQHVLRLERRRRRAGPRAGSRTS